MLARLLSSLVALAILAACSGPESSARATSTPPSPTAAPTATGSPLPSGAIRFAAIPDRSQATIRVREQIAAVPAPGDAVLTTKAFSGTLVLLADGTFAPASKLSADLDSLKSDSDLRDEWIKVNTLNTRVFPFAEFAPTRVTACRYRFRRPANGTRPSTER